MGKQLQRRISYGGVHPHSPAGGCFWGMFNVLDYHHWNYVKKLLHHKKHHGRRRLQCFATPKTVSFSFHDGEEHLDDDSEHLLGEHRVDQDNSQKTSSSRETSNKNRKHHRRSSNIISNQTNQIMIFHENAEDPYICFEEHSNSNHTNAKFTKARSFPVPDGSSRRYRPSTMNHKQNEVWFLPKGKPLKIVALETHNHNSEPTHKDASHGWNHLIKSQFKGFKKIIKRALQETRKETKKSSSKRKEESATAKEKNNVRQMTRLSSLNESADKYAQLFDRSFSGTATSKSLKLSFEDDKVGGDVAKSYRRRHSLPDYETLISLLGEVSQETLYSGLLAWTKSEIEKSKELRPSFDIKSEEIAESGSRSGADLGIETDRCQEIVFESGMTETPFDFDDAKIATVENKALDQGAFLSFEGAELASWSPPNLADQHPDPGSVKEIDLDFKFVSDILKSAGFIETKPIPPWDSIELPLNPQLFDELEAPKPHDLECRDHQLLFDLINEALLEMYERLFSYFPRPLSFSPYTRPITKGRHVVDEVWKTVKSYTSTRLLECDRSLDDVVARDMAKRDGWMSLEWDCECLAVELEDSILNELIDELLYS